MDYTVSISQLARVLNQEHISTALGEPAHRWIIRQDPFVIDEKLFKHVFCPMRNGLFISCVILRTHWLYNVQAPCLIADIELFHADAEQNRTSLSNSADIYLTLDETMDVRLYICVPSFLFKFSFLDRCAFSSHRSSDLFGARTTFIKDLLC